MTRENIEGMREVVLPFVKKKLLEINYENLGKSDAEEFERHFNEILDLALKALEQKPTTKNDLGVDAVSRDKVKSYIQAHIHEIITESGEDKNKHTNRVLRSLIHGVDCMPSVTPQLSSELEKLERGFGESDCISRADALEMADMLDLETGYDNEKVEEMLKALSSVTPIRPKGHWIIMKDIYGDIVDAICSNCEHHGHHKWNYCPNCSAEMNSNTIRKGKPIEGNNESLLL